MAEDSERLLNKPRKTIKSEHIARISSLRKSKLKALKSIEKNYEKVINLNNKKMGHLETTSSINSKTYLVDNVNKQKRTLRPGLIKNNQSLDKTFQVYENSNTNTSQTDRISLEWSRNSRKRNISRYANENGQYDVRYKENFNKNASEIINDVKHTNQQEDNTNNCSLSNEVVVPSWRVVLFKANYRLEKTENLNDEAYLKRHQKPENEEKQIKRWDLRRQREQYEREKLLKMNNTNNVNSENDEDKLDETDEQLLIEIVDSKSDIDEKMNANKTSTTPATISNNNFKKKTIIVKRLNANKKPNINNKNRLVRQNSNSITSNNNIKNSNCNNNVFKVYDFDIDSDSNDNIFVHTHQKSIVKQNC